MSVNDGLACIDVDFVYAGIAVSNVGTVSIES